MEETSTGEQSASGSHTRPPAPEGGCRILLQTLSISQVSKIDSVEQHFVASFLLQLRFPDGAGDEHLSAKGVVAPTFADGKLSVGPSAEWYGEQVEITNAVGKAEKLDQRVFPDGSDLLMNQRFSGEFFEEMEMEAFPFDIQDLYIKVVILCRNGGPLPVNLQVASNVVAQVQPDGFQLHHSWQLMRARSWASRPDKVAPSQAADDDAGALIVELSTFGKGKRQFPALDARAVVGRRATYYVVNLMVPMAAFCLLSFIQWAYEREHLGPRNSIGFSCVLAWVGYKFVSATLIPRLSYLTLLDQHSSFCGLLVLSSCVGCTLVAVPKGADEEAERWDSNLFYAHLAMFVVGHLYLAHAVRKSHRKQRRQHGF